MRCTLGVMVAHLTGNAQPLGRLGGIDGDLIVRLVAVRKAEVVVLRLEVDIGGEQDVLDLLPEDARHSSPSISTSGVFIWIFAIELLPFDFGIIILVL